MASAGRILIIPKGEYDSSVTYEMLDLVKHNGTSWIAKKTTVGIEPSVDNSEYWQDMFNITDIVLPNATKFATGTYVGTGNNLSKNLSFAFTPKIVIILGQAADNIANSSTTILIPGLSVGNTTLNMEGVSIGQISVKLDDNNITLTSDTDTNLKAYYLCDDTSFTYNYAAIG